MAIAPPKSGWLTWSGWLRAVGGVLLLCGGVALAGRLTGVNELMSIVPGSSRMPTATALLLLGLGFGVLQMAGGRAKLARGCGWGVAGFAALMIVGRLAGDALRPDMLLGRLLTAAAPTAGSDQVGATASLSLLLGGLLVVCLAENGLRQARLAVLSGGLLGLTLLTLLKYVTGLQMALPGGLQFGLAVPVMVSLLLLAVTGLAGAARRTAGQRGQPATAYTVAALVMLTCVGLFGLHLNNEQQLATARLVGSYEIVASANYIELLVTRMELASREFALTGETAWAAYAADLDHRLRAELNLFNRLLAEHGGEGADAAALRQLVAGFRQGVAHLTRRDRADDPAAGPEPGPAAALGSQMALLRDRVNAVEFNCRRQQARDAAAVRANSYETIKIILIGNVVAGLLGFVALAQMLRAEKKLSAKEQELRGVNQLQRAVLDGGVFSVIATEPDGTIREFNRGAERMLGYTREEMVGKQTPLVIHVGAEVAARATELGAQLGRPLAPGFETFVARTRLGETDEREWTYVRKDGTRLPVQLSVTALRNEAGDITGFLGIAQDLTERKRAEVTLQASEERLGQVLGHAECLVWEARVTLKGDDWEWSMSVYPSGLYRRLTEEYARNEGTGLWYKFAVPEQAEMNQRSRKAMEQGLPGYTQEFRLQRDGRTTWVRETVAIRPQGGGHYWLVGVVIDVTDRKQLEIALRDSEERWGFALEGSNSGVWDWNAETNEVFFSRQWKAMLGHAEDEVGCTLAEWERRVHPEDLAGAYAALQRHFAGEEPFYQHEHRLRHKDGRWIWIQDRGKVVSWIAPGRPRRVIGTHTDITDRKHAAEALAASEERFRNAFDYAGIGMALVGLDGRWLQVNQIIRHLLGYTEEELLARTFQDVTHPDDLRADLDNVQDLLEGRRRHYQMEKRYIHREGRIVHVRLTVTLVRDATGAPLHFISQIEDITARHLAEQALIESQRQLSDVFRSMAEGLVLLDAQGRIIECNAAAENILGLTRSQMMGLTAGDSRWQALSEDGTPCPADRHPATITRMTGQPCRGVVMGVHKADGTLRWLSVNTEAIMDENGYLRSVVASFADVTDRKRATEALAESEERMRLFAEHAPASVAMFDRGMRYLVHSAKWLKDYGLEDRDIIGRSHYEVFPEVGERWREIHRRCLAGATEVSEADPFDRSDGTRQWLSWRVQPWHNAAGEIGGIVMFTEDITARKQLEDHLALARDQALEASRLKSAFLANMSHEIRTPMNGVLGMADLLMESPLNEEQQQMGRVIQNSARNLLTIIDDILDLSKIEAGKLSIEARPFDLGEQIDQALALLSPRAQARGLRLDSELPAEPVPGVCGDAGRLQQVLVNLLGNAVKFTERGGVTLVLRERPPVTPGGYAFRIEVRDTGIGVAAGQQNRLFQAFSQADDSLTRKYGGTGLGLAISRQLVDLMGGRIGVESEAGRGSVFWFELELPRAAKAGPVPAGREAARAIIPAAARILVAEDNEANQLVIRLMLGKLGLDYDIVGDGPSALRQLDQGGYAAVLMDCQMPGLDGYETTRRIRDGAAGTAQARIPIFALTAHAMASDREKCLEAGMNDYLAKPIRLEALQQVFMRFGITTTAPVAPTPGPAAGPVLDAGQLAELRGLPGEHDGESLLDLLVRKSLAELPPAFARLHELADRRAAAELAQAAHRVAGSAASIGANPLRLLLLALERAARQEDWPAVAGHRSELDRQTRLLQDALEALRQNPGP